jgi:ribulose-5-phosphate 4-epimerase/fuculose-1-phosphate aldolase
VTADIRRRVVVACRALAAAGQQDMVWGHVGIRDPGGQGVWIKRSGLALDEVAKDDIHLVGWDGSLVEGEGKPHIECHIHLSILRARADVEVSVHNHPEAVNAFSALEVPLRAISHDGVLFALPQVPRTGLSGDLVSDIARGEELARSLGEARACLMPRHGMVAVGKTDAEAVMHAVLLERACAVFLRASAAGELRSWSDDAELVQKAEHAWPTSQIDAGYAYLVRSAGGPG